VVSDDSLLSSEVLSELSSDEASEVDDLRLVVSTSADSSELSELLEVVFFVTLDDDELLSLLLTLLSLLSLLSLLPLLSVLSVELSSEQSSHSVTWSCTS
jgi:hypothetical protein